VAFREFYRQHYLPEHRHPATVALHVAGTLVSAAWVPAALLSPLPWLALLYPVVHAAPGLLAHRLFERNAEVGDLRITRTDFPKAWFIAANHVLTWRVITGRRP
jgi:hypothetical protein